MPDRRKVVMREICFADAVEREKVSRWETPSRCGRVDSPGV